MEKKWLYNKWLMISLSAWLGVLPFLFTHYCAEIIFIFLIPLFFISTKKDLYFKEGFYWGIIFYAAYFYGLHEIIFYHGYGSYRLIAGIMLIIYGALYVGFWFYGCTLLSNFFAKKILFLNAVIIKMSCWILGSFIYFLFIDSGFFWVFGLFEGDQLRFPLLPLATRIEWLRCTYFLPRYVMLFLLLIFSASCMGILVTKQKKWPLLFTILSFMPFFGGWLLPKKSQETPSFLQQIVCITPKVCQQNPYEASEHLAQLLCRCAKMPSVHTVFLPESSFQFPLNCWQSAISLWYDCLENDEKYIILGSHRQENDFLFNTLYVLHDRRIIYYYDKKHSMFFTERIPPGWLKLPGIKNLFLKNKVPFSPGKKCGFFNHPLLGSMLPSICSELFFQPLAAEPVVTPGLGDSKLLCLVNDSWFASHYIPYLMYLQGKYKAFYLQKDLFYVSYLYCRYITKTGASYPLTTLP